MSGKAARTKFEAALRRGERQARVHVDLKRRQMKAAFVKELARFLTLDQAEMAIALETKDPAARKWAALRFKTPLFGCPTPEEAERMLRDFLS